MAQATRAVAPILIRKGRMLACRPCLLLLALGACVDAPLPPADAPTFVRQQRPQSIEASPPRWFDGETLAFGVSWRGLPVGTARLTVRRQAGELVVESSFRTVGLATQVHPVSHHLRSSARGRLPGTDDLHRALGRVRGWAAVNAPPAHLRVRYGGRTYQVRLAEPVIDDSLARSCLRIEGQARSAQEVIDITFWLSNDSQRVPLQVTLAHEGQRVYAELIDRPDES